MSRISRFKNKDHVILPFLLLLLGSPQAWSFTAGGNLAVGGLSDGVYYRRLKLETITQPVELTYPYRDEADDQFSWGTSAEMDYRELYNMHTDSYFISGTAIKKFARHFQISTQLGLDDTSTAGTDSTLNGHGLLNFSGIVFQDKFDYSLTFEHALADSLLEVEDHLPTLRVNDLQLKMSYFFSRRLKIDALGNWGWLTDGNIRKYGTLDAMYGIGITDPWFWVGFGGDWLRFTNNTDDYWSPARFRGFGPRLEFASAIAGDWSGTFGGSVDRIQEDDNVWGWGGYFSFGLQWKKRDETHVTLTWNHTRSERNDNLWTQNELVLNVMGYF